jgi:DNA-binding MarR family transcriptional regulator
MSDSAKHSITYLRFLHLVQAIRQIPTFPKMDPVEERLLTMLGVKWHDAQQVSVLEAMGLSTAHRRLKTLRQKGMIELDVDKIDSRVKYVVPTELARKYFVALGQAIDKAAQPT